MYMKKTGRLWIILGGIAGAMHEAGSKAEQPFARITAHATTGGGRPHWVALTGPLVGCRVGELAGKGQPDR